MNSIRAALRRWIRAVVPPGERMICEGELQARDAVVNIYQHPLAGPVELRNQMVRVPAGMSGIQIHGFSTYGRFLFTELDSVGIYGCVVIDCTFDFNPADVVIRDNVFIDTGFAPQHG